MRNPKRSRADLESDLDAKAAPDTVLGRIAFLKDQIAVDEKWQNYYRSVNQPAPYQDESLAQARAELYALLDKPALSNDELIIKQAAARVGATAVIVRDGSDLDSDADAWLNSAGAIVYRAEPPAALDGSDTSLRAQLREAGFGEDGRL